jgi:opacity protein-like surface antigen
MGMGAFVKRLASLAAGTCVLLSGTAYAADIPFKAPPRPVWTDSWAGYYFGVYFGAGAGRASEVFAQSETDSSLVVTAALTRTSNSPFNNFGNLSGDVTGSMVELFAGHNWRIGNFVLGAQVEGTVFSDVSLKMTGNQAFSASNTQVETIGGVTTTTATTSASTFTEDRYEQLRSNVGVIGRVGYLVTPDILLYGLGGLALGHFVFPDGGNLFGGKDSKWVAGYTLGAGGEYRLDDNWSLRAEYRYLHYDLKRGESNSSSVREVTATSTFTSSESFNSTRKADVDLHVGKVGLVYRFVPDGNPRATMAAMPSTLATTDSWAGLYYGIYFGAGSGRAKDSFTTTNTDSGLFTALNGNTNRNLSVQNRVGGGSGDMTGSTVDLFAGYNWRFGSVVAGGQVEGTLFSDLTLKALGTTNSAQTSTQINTVGGVVTSSSSSNASSFNEAYHQQLRSNVGVIGRVGFLVTPDILLYGLGGLALGHFVYPDVNEDATGGKNGKWVAGYTAGAGGEVKLNDNWSLRAEYRYLHFGFGRDEGVDQTSTQVSAGGTSSNRDTNTTARHIDADLHIGKVGVVYKFGPGGNPLSSMAAIPASLETADSWAGFYFGAYFGAGIGHAKESGTEGGTDTSRFVSGATDSRSTSSFSAVSDRTGDMTGSTVDLFVGRNWRFGSFVAGGQVEGTVFSDVALKTIGPSLSATSSVSTNNGVITSSSSGSGIGLSDRNDQLRSNFAVIGRAGFLVTPDILLYGLGGLSLGHFVHPDGSDFTNGKNGKWVAGYTAGAGGEVKLNDNWSLRAEYRYLHFDFDRDDASSSSSASTSATSTSSSLSTGTTNRQVRADFHTGKVGIVYKFGPGGGSRSAMAAIPKALAPSDSWAGLYFGAYFGAGQGDAGTSWRETSAFAGRTVTAAGVTTGNGSNGRRSGELAGDVTGSTVDLFVGHNWRFGSVVAGGQVEGTLFSDVALKTSGHLASSFVQTTTSAAGVVTTTSTNTTTSFNEYRNQLRSNVGLIARAGFLVTPDALLYGLGGLALGHFVYPDSTDPFGDKNGKWVAGYTVGAGGELKLNQNWSLRAEYRYLHFDVERDWETASATTNRNLLTGTTTFSTNSAAHARNTDVAFHTGKVGIVYKFGAR